MDVTPRELRDLEIREQFRGYHREDVDDLLERAAKTIETQNERLRQMNEKLTHEPVGAPAPAAPSESTREMEQTLQRTLVLAQRTADMAVAEAEEQARATLEDAEARARVIMTDAETQARRLAESERNRLQNEILELGSKREALLSDVEALERFDNDYRTRLREAIEADLSALDSRSAVPMAPRPAIHEVAMPTISASERSVPIAPSFEQKASSGAGSFYGNESGPDAPAPESSSPDVEEPSESAPMSGSVPAAPAAPPSGDTARDSSPGSNSEPPQIQPSRPAPARSVLSRPEPRTDPRADPRTDPPRAQGSRGTAPKVQPPPKRVTAVFKGDEPIEAEVLDDDAFFASLREAVRDESPLGPRDDIAAAGDDMSDASSDPNRLGSVFKRRR